MKKMPKKFFVTAMLSLIILIGATTTAEAYTNFYFSLRKGERDWTGPVTKPDSYQFAGIQVRSGNIISSDEVYMRVRDYGRNYATEAVKITSNYSDYYPDYTVRRGVYGNKYYLYCQTDVYSVSVSGSWEP